MTSDWTIEVSKLMEIYAAKLGVSQTELAYALGSEYPLSQSRLASSSHKYFYLLIQSAQRKKAPEVIRRLGVPFDKYKYVYELFGEIFKELTSEEVDMMKGGLGPIEIGKIGSELLFHHREQSAFRYLKHCRDALRGHEADLDDDAFSTLLHVVCDLFSYMRFRAVELLAEEQQYLAKLLDEAKGRATVPFAAPPLIIGYGRLLTQIGTAHWWYKTRSPSQCLPFYVQAAEVLRRVTTPQERAEEAMAWRIKAIRDQAKPLIAHSILVAQGDGARSLVELAYDRLDEADRLVGDQEPPDKLKAFWITTQATRVECFVIMGRVGDAEATWGTVIEKPWMPGFLARTEVSSIHTLKMVTEMLLAAAIKDTGTFKSLTALKSLQAAGDYPMRKPRIEALDLYLQTENPEYLRRAVLGDLSGFMRGEKSLEDI